MVAKRAHVFVGFCFLFLPLSFVLIIYWLFFLQNHKTHEDDGGVVTKVKQHTTVEFSIPNTAVGYVIGRGGSNVRQVEESTSTRIKFKEDTLGADGKIVVVTGRPEAVERARAAIQATVGERLTEELVTASMSIPGSAVGRIIGKQGSNIRSMQKETGAQLHIDSGRRGDEGVCTIRGSEKQVQMAQQLLKEAISKVMGGRSEDVDVPLEAVGRIIGRQGSNIQRIQQLTGATIAYDRNFVAEGVGRFTVRGSDDQIEGAKNLLLGSNTGPQSLVTTAADAKLGTSELPHTCEYFSVFVSAVEAGGDVWLQQVGHCCDELDAMIDAMTSSYGSKALTQDRLARVAVGTVCAAPFHSDGSWYRAVVEGLDMIIGTATLRYVDFGDTGIVELGTLKVLRPEYLVLPAQAIRCSLAHVKRGKSWSARSEQDLRTLTLCSTWKPLMVRTIASSPDPPCVEMVDTTTEKDINIASEMVALGHMEWIQDMLPGVCAGSTAIPTYLSLPPVGSVFTAFVTSVHTPELLFIQPQEHQPKVEELTRHMNELYAGAQTLHTSTLAPGDVVAASSLGNGLWYRGQVISCDPGEDSVLLQYLDYGHHHRVPLQFVRPIVPELMEYPVCTVPCCLADVAPTGATWDPAATKFVQDRTKAGEQDRTTAGEQLPLLAVVSSYIETSNGKLPSVTLTLTSEAHPINALLIEAGLATAQKDLELGLQRSFGDSLIHCEA